MDVKKYNQVESSERSKSSTQCNALNSNPNHKQCISGSKVRSKVEDEAKDEVEEEDEEKGDK